LSVFGGFIKVPKWLEPMFPLAEKPEDLTLVGISVAAGVIGIALAYFLYVMRPGLADSIAASFGVLYKLVYNKYFVDEIYDTAVVQPTVTVSRAVLWRGVDVGSIDRLVNGVATFARWIGGVLKLFQSGNIRSYATWVLFGSIILIITVGLMGVVR
jgi:NADH-quinone oxidoreductase subunit L